MYTSRNDAYDYQKKIFVAKLYDPLESYDQKHSVLLPDTGRLTQFIIQDAHTLGVGILEEHKYIPSTDASTFLASFKRFVSHRGPCLYLYSDHGTNFFGDSTQLRSRASHHGSLWEVGVEGFMCHLRYIEELLTVTIQIESCLNSRPLCPMSGNPNDQQSLFLASYMLGK
ncbi:hypothetical protein LAZ67_2004059 [Cordylochernes scorpioides]|uniref:Integrase catalytic domain-containing protein n=1 Tax=Cordylochernes scorpioides TaxID=51811 RepID=A0ABY6K6E7_9ARAC|nr:hypothetical protein LAZ67_2004059 [Cordylochernes scorpioides]